MRIKGTLVLAALAAAAVAIGLGQPAVAAPAARATAAPTAKTDPHVLKLAPAARHERAAGGGGRSHDFTGDGIPDILARQFGSSLMVYENGGSFNGTATYPRATFINGGWGGFSWIGTADLNGDGFADVVATDFGGNMYAAIHSGQFAGTRTLQAGLVFLGSGWTINDLVYVYDFDGDGLDDILARRGGTGDSYVYFNNGLDGTNTLQAPQLFVSGGESDQYQGMADIDGDGSPDFVYLDSGFLVMLAVNESTFGILGYGWDTVNSITFTDVDHNGRDDIIAKRNSDSALLAYQRTATWVVNPDDGTAYGTFNAPVTVGFNWYINDIIA